MGTMGGSWLHPPGSGCGDRLGDIGTGRWDVVGGHCGEMWVLMLFDCWALSPSAFSPCGDMGTSEVAPSSSSPWGEGKGAAVTCVPVPHTPRSCLWPGSGPFLVGHHPVPVSPPPRSCPPPSLERD